jgi:hypothetical protein
MRRFEVRFTARPTAATMAAEVRAGLGVRTHLRVEAEAAATLLLLIPDELVPLVLEIAAIHGAHAGQDLGPADVTS